MRILVFVMLFGLISIETFSQERFNIRKKKINILPIDTTELFIYETENAFLYFSQKDLLDYFSKSTLEKKTIYQPFIDTLNSNTSIIQIKCDTIYDKVFELDRGNGLIQKGEFPSGKDKRDYLTQTFFYVAADLMLQGKVKPFSKADHRFYSKKIIAKTEDGLYGTKFLVFRLPNKLELHQIVTAFGE